MCVYYMYACMYVCVYGCITRRCFNMSRLYTRYEGVCMYVYIYMCMYICTFSCSERRIFAYMYVCMYVCKDAVLSFRTQKVCNAYMCICGHIYIQAEGMSWRNVEFEGHGAVLHIHIHTHTYIYMVCGIWRSWIGAAAAGHTYAYTHKYMHTHTYTCLYIQEEGVSWRKVGFEGHGAVLQLLGIHTHT